MPGRLLNPGQSFHSRDCRLPVPYFLGGTISAIYFLSSPRASSHSPKRSIQWSVGIPCYRMPKPWPPLAYRCSSADLCAAVHCA
jgi:hypothetical protein